MCIYRKKRKPKALLLLGNGFDRALDYDTGYQAFYNSGRIQSLAKQRNNLCKEIDGRKRNDLWSDLETGLYEYSKILTKKVTTPNPSDIDRDNYKNYKKEFLELRQALFNYLINIQNKGVTSKDYPVNLLMFLRDKLEVQAICFNYTSLFVANLNASVLDFYNPDSSVNSDKCIFQHGSLFNSQKGTNNSPNDIVLGIDDSQIVDNKHSFLYKSRQKKALSSQKYQSIIDDKDIFIVFGCSMGDSDREYFESVFNKRNKYYLIYGYGADSLRDLFGRILSYTVDIMDFLNNNKVYFIDSSVETTATQKTKEIIEYIYKYR